MFRLEPHEEIEPGVKRILVEQIDESLAHLNDPAGELDKAVHETRKNFKKMRAVLRLVRDALGDEMYRVENACFRDAGRMIAPLRDSAVLVETVDALQDQNLPEQAAGAYEHARQKLVVHQVAVRKQLLVDSKVFVEVQDILQQARTRVMSISLKATGTDAFTPGLRRVYRRGRRRMKQAYVVQDDPHLFHDWRKRVKYLWHHAELLQVVWPDYMASLARELHLLSAYLGESHDLVVLREMLIGNPAELGADPDLLSLLTLITQKQHELEEKARPLGKRIYVEPAGEFARRLGMYWQVNHTYDFNGVPDENNPFNGEALVEPTQAVALS